MQATAESHDERIEEHAGHGSSALSTVCVLRAARCPPRSAARDGRRLGTTGSSPASSAHGPAREGSHRQLRPMLGRESGQDTCERGHAGEVGHRNELSPTCCNPRKGGIDVALAQLPHGLAKLGRGQHVGQRRRQPGLNRLPPVQSGFAHVNHPTSADRRWRRDREILRRKVVGDA